MTETPYGPIIGLAMRVFLGLFCGLTRASLPDSAGFREENWAAPPCYAWDAKTSMDLSPSSGLTFAWCVPHNPAWCVIVFTACRYDSSRTTSFVVSLCGTVEQYYGVDIITQGTNTPNVCTNCVNSMVSLSVFAHV